MKARAPLLLAAALTAIAGAALLGLAWRGTRVPAELPPLPEFAAWLPAFARSAPPPAAGAPARLALGRDGPEAGSPLWQEEARYPWVPRTRAQADGLRELRRFAETCSGAAPTGSGSPSLAAASRWHAELCAGRAPRAPREELFHPSGQTYAALTCDRDPAAGCDAGRMHVREWARLPVAQRSALRDRLSATDPEVLAAFGSGAGLALDDEIAWVREDHGTGERGPGAELAYRAYARTDLARYLRALGPFALASAGDEPRACARREGNACVDWDLASLRRGASRAAIGAGATLLAAALALLGAGLAQRRRERVAAAGRARAFEAFAHDLRTPLAALRLDLEGSASGERALAQLERIRELAERTEALAFGGGTDPLQEIELGSWLAGWVPRAFPGAELALPSTPVAVATGPESLRLALTQLLGNAFRHGRAPVRLTVRATGRRPEIEVSDAGRWNAERPGWGSGLTLARESLRAIRARLSVERDPATRVRIRL